MPSVGAHLEWVSDGTGHNTLSSLVRRLEQGCGLFHVPAFSECLEKGLKSNRRVMQMHDYQCKVREDYAELPKGSEKIMLLQTEA